MASLRNYYHPIDAAILWSDLAAHETEIVQVALRKPELLLKEFPQWPFLHAYNERICDAIACQELPATYLGQAISPGSRLEHAYMCIRHSDLRIWVARYYPDDKPDFLFSKNIDHAECVSLGAHLAQRAELECARGELTKLREIYSSVQLELKTLTQDHHNLASDLEKLDTPSEVSTVVFYVIIGALLDVTVGKNADGQVQSVYKNQAAVVDAIITRFPSQPGLSKRTLDRKFAEAHRQLHPPG
jgi:hypothetical protein